MRRAVLAACLLLTSEASLPQEYARFLIPDQTIRCRESAQLQVLMTNTMPIVGYSLSLSFEPGVLSLERISQESTIVQDAYFFEASVDTRQGWATVGVLLALPEQSVWRSINPGSAQCIATLIARPAVHETTQTTISFEDGHGDPFPIENLVVFFDGGKVRELAPELLPATIRIVAPEIQVDPPSFDFGWVVVGSVSGRSLTVENTGSAPLSVTSIRVEDTPGPGFEITSDPTPITIPVAERRMAHVVYRPTEAGVAASSLLLESDDCDTPHLSVPLEGKALKVEEGLCPLVDDPPHAPHRFGDTEVAVLRVNCDSGDAVAHWKDITIAAVLPPVDAALEQADPEGVIDVLKVYVDTGTVCGEVDPGDDLVVSGLPPLPVGEDISIPLDVDPQAPLPVNVPLLVAADIVASPDKAQREETSLHVQSRLGVPWIALGILLLGVCTISLGKKNTRVCLALILGLVIYATHGCDDHDGNGPAPPAVPALGLRYELRQLTVSDQEGDNTVPFLLNGPLRRIAGG